MAAVSVVTWNLHQGFLPAGTAREALSFLETEVRPTVALIQEAIPRYRPVAAGGAVWCESDDLPFETGVLGCGARIEALSEAIPKYKPYPAFPLTPTTRPTHAVARVIPPDGMKPFVAISLYGRIMRKVFAQTSILDAISDLIPLFDDPRYNDRIVIGGDLNIFNNGPRVDAVSRERWAAILDLFKSLGLVNLLEKTQGDRGPLPGCLCRMEDECYHVETWRANKAVPGVWCLDYLFATREMADRMTGTLDVWATLRPEVWRVWQLSDHCPVGVRFDL